MSCFVNFNVLFRRRIFRCCLITASALPTWAASTAGGRSGGEGLVQMSRIYERESNLNSFEAVNFALFCAAVVNYARQGGAVLWLPQLAWSERLRGWVCIFECRVLSERRRERSAKVGQEWNGEKACIMWPFKNYCCSWGELAVFSDPAVSVIFPFSNCQGV